MPSITHSMEQTDLPTPIASVITTVRSMRGWSLRYGNYKSYLLVRWGAPTDLFTNPQNLFDNLNNADKEWFKIAIHHLASIR